MEFRVLKDSHEYESVCQQIFNTLDKLPHTVAINILNDCRDRLPDKSMINPDQDPQSYFSHAQ